MADFKNPSMPTMAAPPSDFSDANAQPLLYHIPFWSDMPPNSYHYQLEVIHQGSIQQVIPLDSKPFYLIGRTPICDIVIDNDVCYPVFCLTFLITSLYCQKPGFFFNFPSSNFFN
jgi:hypothetical protein